MDFFLFFRKRGVFFLDQQGFEFVVEYEYEGTAGTAEDVGESSFEESASAFGLGDDRPAVHGVLVDDFGFGSAGLHHHSPTHGVEGVGDDTGAGGDDLSDTPGDEETGLLGVGKHSLGCVEATEVRSSVDDDTLDGYAESSVQADQTVLLEDL